MRVLIVDDEPTPRERLRRLLDAESDVEVVGDAEDGRDALEAIKELRPDVAFLDIQMPELNGLEVARRIDESIRPLIVFVTAYDQYAIEAFEVHAFDYLLKPFDATRLQTPLRRARARLAAGERTDPSSIQALLRQIEATQRELAGKVPAAEAFFLERVLVRFDGRAVPVKVADVERFEAAGNYVRLHTARGPFEVRDTLAKFESRLDPKQFQRVHRKMIVNLDAVKEIQTWFSGDYMMLLRSGAKVRLSRYYRQALRALGASGEDA